MVKTTVVNCVMFKEILKEIEKFGSFAVSLKTEGWEIDDILNILQIYLKSKFEVDL